MIRRLWIALLRRREEHARQIDLAVRRHPAGKGHGR